MAKKKSIYTETDASQARKKKGQGNAAGVGIPTLMAAAKGLREAGKSPRGPLYRAAAKIAGQEFGAQFRERVGGTPAGARGPKAQDFMKGGISEGTDMAKHMRLGKASKNMARKYGTAGGGSGRGGARVEGLRGMGGGGEGGILKKKIR